VAVRKPLVLQNGRPRELAASDTLPVSNLPAGARLEAFNATFDNGGQVLAVGTKIRFFVPYAHNIVRVLIGADQTGSVVFDVWRDTHANYPPTVADSVCGSNKPTLVSAEKYDDQTLTGWSASASGAAWYVVNLDSVVTITNATLALVVEAA
jgi:hypothetical protein